MLEPDCFFRYRVHCNAEFYYVGKIRIGRPSQQRRVVLSRRNIVVGGKCALPSAPLFIFYSKHFLSRVQSLFTKVSNKLHSADLLWVPPKLNNVLKTPQKSEFLTVHYNARVYSTYIRHAVSSNDRVFFRIWNMGGVNQRRNWVSVTLTRDPTRPGTTVTRDPDWPWFFGGVQTSWPKPTP